MAYIGPAPKLGQNREVDDISSGFNGSTTAFTLQVDGSNASPGSANNILVSVNNVLLNPNTAYTVNGSTITFTSAPTNGQAFFGLILGQGIDSGEVSNGSVSTAKLADDAVTYAKMQNVSATDTEIDSSAGIVGTKLANNTIGAAQIAAGAITNTEIDSSAAIAGSKLADAGITTAKIADDAITSAKIADDAVVTAALSNSAVTSSKLADNAVSTAKINDGAVTAAKLASGVGGKVLQVVQSYKTNVFTSSAQNTFTDITGLSVSITPSSSSNKVLIIANVEGSSPDELVVLRLLRGSTVIGASSVGDTYNGFGMMDGEAYGGNVNRTNEDMNTTFLDTPSTTSSTTYKIQFLKNGTGTFAINRRKLNAGVGFTSAITVMEIGA